MKQIIIFAFAAIVASGCSATHHRAAVAEDPTDRITVGTVQKEIYIGMTGAEVAQTIGSPNIVSTDAERHEVWIYDKIATDVAYSDSQGGVLGLIIGPVGSGAAAGVGAGTYGSGARSTSQRTLTVVINFDGANRVRDFAYHTSRF